MFGASSELASVMEFGFNEWSSALIRLCYRRSRCRCAAPEQPCPSPYAVDYDVAKSLSVQLNVLDADDRLVDDGSDALSGSAAGGLQVPGGYRWFTVELRLDDSAEICGRWEIDAFSLTVIGVDSFVVTIGDVSSDVVEVHNADQYSCRSKTVQFQDRTDPRPYRGALQVQILQVQDRTYRGVLQVSPRPYRGVLQVQDRTRARCKSKTVQGRVASPRPYRGELQVQDRTGARCKSKTGRHN